MTAPAPRRHAVPAPPADDPATAALRAEYRALVNEILPAKIQEPVRFDHCFARCALDWLCGGVWYDAIEKPAWRHLTADQLGRVNGRMRAWLADRALLEADNATSLRYRGKAS